jgi:LPXTG-motif cell wall-anchored protein/uncharacterized repeat protein (TIGR01451 family)
MKAIKKLLMGFLVSVMVLGMGLTAFAAGEGSITITNAKNGQEYKAYRVFDFVAADTDDMANGGVYKLASKFSGLASYTSETYGAASSYFTVGDNGILNTSGLGTTNDADAVKNFGKLVLEYVSTNSVVEDGKNTASKDGELNITGLDYGYYVIDSSLGSAVAIDTTKPNAEIKEKNSVPDLDKKITGEKNSGAADDKETTVDLTGNNAQIGDTVTFTIKVDLKANGENYEIVDILDAGLTLVENFDITFSNGAVAYDAPVISTTADSKTTFSIKFTEIPTADTTCTVVYKATVNTDAVIATDANKNEAYLKYGHDTETTHKETKTKTYPIQLKKVISGTETILAGAKFNVYRKTDGQQVKFTKVSDTQYTVDPAGEITEIVTVDTTPITLNGFDAEAYVLVETEAPSGYNLLVAKDNATYTLSDGTTTTHFQEVTVTESHGTTNPAVATVENSTGSLLPSTGGIGTTIFYIVGGILIAAGVAYFMVRRKADAE